MRSGIAELSEPAQWNHGDTSETTGGNFYSFIFFGPHNLSRRISSDPLFRFHMAKKRRMRYTPKTWREPMASTLWCAAQLFAAGAT